MTTVSNARVFLDTNILFYTNNPSEAFGQQALSRLNEMVAQNNELVISTQIIREYANATLRHAIYQKIDLPASIGIVQRNITRFQRDFEVLHESPLVLQHWLILLPSLTTSKDVYDFNIAATMQSAGISHLLTHNVSDFVKFSAWLTVLPLFP